MENCHSSGWWSEESDWNWMDQSNNNNDILETNEVPSRSTTSSQFHGDDTTLVHQPWSEGFTDEIQTPSASKSHSLAEKRRRDRINAQLASLRKLIPKSDKMDKAALLGSVIDQVKDLKRKASEIINKNILVPTETDEVSIDVDVHDNTTPSSSKSCIFIRASVCCDDRPELYAELIRVFKGLKLTMVRADITSVGGRTRSILVLCSKNKEEEEEEEKEGFSVTTLRNSLKVVLSRIASASVASSCRSIRSRRQRFFFP